jgi:metal-sulfur cluster biosynthetic enzyme
MPMTRDEVREALKSIYDPELGYNIVDLGLIYDAEVGEDGRVKVLYTLTSPACPVGPYIQNQIEGTLLGLPGVSDVETELTFNPPWDPREYASEEIKAELGIW